MIINDYEFWNKYEDPIKIKYDRILITPQIKSFLKRNLISDLEKAWRRATMQHMYYILKGIDVDLNWICLDLGSGIGRIAKSLSDFCFKIVCYDISPKIIEEGKKYCEGYNIEFNLVKNDTIGRKVNSIDFAYSILTFQHFHEEDKFTKYLTMMYGILKKGGIFRFQVTTSDKVNPEEKTNFNGITSTEENVKKIAKNIGYDIIGYDHALGDKTWDWITLQR